MARLNLLLVILKQLGAAADRCQQLREELERLGPPLYDPPSLGAVVVSIIGLSTVPAAVLCDYHLLSAPIDYICQLSGAASTHAARILVPVALTLVNLAASINRSEQAYSDNAFAEYEPKTRQLINPVITIVLLLQVAAAVAQYLALQSVHPAPANALILILLCGLAIVCHISVYVLGGNAVRLLSKACSEAVRAARRRRANNALRQARRALVRHFQAWNAAKNKFLQATPGASVPELDPVAVKEINLVIGPPSTPQSPAPQAPPSTHSPSTPGSLPSEPPNPYIPVNDDHRL